VGELSTLRAQRQSHCDWSHSPCRDLYYVNVNFANRHKLATAPFHSEMKLIADNRAAFFRLSWGLLHHTQSEALSPVPRYAFMMWC
jgi:hypothetical protein